jgi:ornithine--oxo-acid transaminase
MLLPPIEYGLDSNLQTNVNPTTGKIMRYGNIQDIEECLAEHHRRVAAVIMECLHGALKSVHQIMQFNGICLLRPF